MLVKIAYMQLKNYPTVHKTGKPACACIQNINFKFNNDVKTNEK